MTDVERIAEMKRLDRKSSEVSAKLDTVRIFGLQGAEELEEKYEEILVEFYRVAGGT